MKREEKQHRGRASQGKIDVEAPSPSDVCSEGAANQRAECGRDAKYGTSPTLVLGPLV